MGRARPRTTGARRSPITRRSATARLCAQRFPATHALSTREQAGVDGAPDDVLDALAEGNRRYEETFGYIFIVCASGRSAEEMLAMLTARLGNDPAREIRVAAGEQAKITALRLGSSA